MDLLQHLSQTATASLLTGVWQGIVLAAAVALALRIAPKTTAAVRFTIWFGAFAVMALLPFLHLAPHSSVSAHAGTILTLDPRWSFALAAGWLAASLVRASILVVGAASVRALWKRAKPIRTITIPALSQPKMVLRRAELCTSAEVNRPSVIGFFSPRILIPAWLIAKLTEEELDQIVLHETGHLRRADDWINLLQKIGLVLFPLNPALLWVERRLCFERELACDDAVLELTNAPKSYATCLTSLAEHRIARLDTARRSLSLSLGALGRQSELGRRIHSILQPSQRMSPAQARFAVGIAALLLLGGTAELARCPQLVSFAPSAQIAASAPLRLSPDSPSSPHQPAAFHIASAPHETLLKVSEPVTQSSATRFAKPSKVQPGKVQPAKVHLAAHLVHAVAPVPAETHQWLVMATWQDAYGARMVLTTIQEPSEVHVSPQSDQPPPQISPYTAVPIRGGWLVIQL
jgi:Zn-dependent protease with chaperone function